MARRFAGSVVFAVVFIVTFSLVMTACGGDTLPGEAREFAIEYLATRHGAADDWAISDVQKVPADGPPASDEKWCLKVQEVSKASDLNLGRLAGVAHYILSRSGEAYRIEPIISRSDWYLHDCIGW